jgi:hypothetical protein
VVTIASWLPACGSPAAAGAGPAVLMCYGDADTVIPLQWGRASAQRVARARGRATTRFRKYARVEHTATEEVLADVASFLRASLPKTLGAAATSTQGASIEGWENEAADEELPIAEMIRRRQEGRRGQVQVTRTLERLHADLGGGGGEGRGGREGG